LLPQIARDTAKAGTSGGIAGVGDGLAHEANPLTQIEHVKNEAEQVKKKAEERLPDNVKKLVPPSLF
jgi:hypothetical protein